MLQSNRRNSKKNVGTTMKKSILTLLILLTISTNATAENTIQGGVEKTDEPITLNFKDAINLALEKNRKLRAYKYKVNAQEQFIGLERGNFLPNVDFNQNFMWTNNPAQVFSLKLNQENLTSADFAGAPASFNDPGDYTNFLSEIRLEQTIYNKGNFLKLKIAKNDYDAGRSEFARVTEKVALEVARAFLNVQTTKEYVDVAQKSIETAKEHNRIANVRYKNELGLYSDVLRTNTFLKQAEQRLVSAAKNHEVAKKALGLSIGIQKTVETKDNAPELQITELSDYKESSLLRGDIRAMEINIENSEKRIGLQKAMYYPELKTGGNYQVYSKNSPFGFEGDNFQLFGLFRWNLFNGLKRPHLVKIAEYELEQAKEQLDDLKNNVEFEVFSAYKTVDEKRKNLELSEAALASAEEGMKLVEVRYKNSLSPIIDVLDAQLNLDNARAAVAKSRNEYLFSLINLSFASGCITKDLDIKVEEL